MNKFKLSLCSLTLCAFISAPLINAHASWLDTGVDLLKNLDTATSSTTEASSTTTTSTTKDVSIPSNLSSSEISKAFKEALNMGTDAVTKQLSAQDGFNGDKRIHIPLPAELETMRTLLDKVGMAQVADDLEVTLNRAAEAAVPKAKDLFVNAISEMSFEDVMSLYNGADDSATTYFQSKMQDSLKVEMQPVIDEALSQVGALQLYDSMVAEYKTMPFVPDVKSDLNNHVLDKGIDGIFYYLAQQEIAIRENPQAQTTALLKKVFGLQ